MGEGPSLHLGLIMKREVLACRDYITQADWMEESLRAPISGVMGPTTQSQDSQLFKSLISP